MKQNNSDSHSGIEECGQIPTYSSPGGQKDSEHGKLGGLVMF